MMKTSPIRCLLGIAVLAVAATGCARKPVQPDVLLVTVGGPVTLPETVEAGARVYINAYSPAPFTLPAAASVLTGRLPPEHGLRMDGVGSIRPDVSTVATTLSARGYDCAAFLTSPALDRRQGLTNGFSTYVMRPPSVTGLVEAVSAHLQAADRRRPQFVWAHVEVADGEEASEAMVSACTRLLSRVPADAIRAVVPLYGRDPDARFHGLSVDDATVRVRLVLWGRDPPGLHPEPVSLAEVHAWLLGGSLTGRVPVYSESVLPWYAFRLPPLQHVRGGADARLRLGLETVTADVLATQAQWLALRRRGHLGEGLIPAYTNTFGEAGLDEAGRIRVSRAAEAFALPAEAGVPALRELIQAYPDVAIFHEWLGNLHWQARDYTEACNAYGRASDLGVNRVWAYRQQSLCHMLIGNIPLAIDTAENAFLLNPDDPALRRGLSRLLLNAGTALLAAGQHAAAAECLNRVYWLEPGHPDGIFQLARLQLALAETNSAVGLLREALTIKPDHAPSKRLLQTVR